MFHLDHHISNRIVRGLSPGPMRTFSGFATCLDIYFQKLTPAVKEIIARTALGPVVDQWVRLMGCKTKCNLMVIRAMIDRFHDTTTTFHMAFGEVAMTLEDFGMISGLPWGPDRIRWAAEGPSLDSDEVRGLIGDCLPREAYSAPNALVSSYITDHFERVAVLKGREPNTPEQDARLWLWNFLGSTHFSDKGERFSTRILPFLADLTQLGRYDWVTAAFAEMTRCLQVMVRPLVIESASAVPIVGPGLILETWIYSFFPCLAPKMVRVHPKRFPAGIEWRLAQPKSTISHYPTENALVNKLCLEDFVAHPWTDYEGVPEYVAMELRPRRYRRMLLPALFRPI